MSAASKPSEDAVWNRLLAVVDKFEAQVKAEFESRLDKWKPDFAHPEIHAVIGALVARQATLAIQIATAPPIWNDHTAPILLRAMADVHITIEWLGKDLTERCKRFIHYGLGQLKLELEHRRAEMATRKAKEGESQPLDAVEQWINSQRFTYLTEVNLGSWSDMPVRKMADEAGCLDFYNFVYAPFSPCAHSMWQHVARFNLQPCSNPLHRYHMVGKVPVVEHDPYYLHLAAKYLQKTFAAFDQITGLQYEGPVAFDTLRAGLDTLTDDEQAERVPPNRSVSSKGGCE